MKRVPTARATLAEEQSSPNSAGSSFMEFSLSGGAFGGVKRAKAEPPAERAASPGRDDENGSARKKLRLSKEQSAFLKESFKEHNTLNPVTIITRKQEDRERISLRYLKIKSALLSNLPSFLKIIVGAKHHSLIQRN